MSAHPGWLQRACGAGGALLAALAIALAAYASHAAPLPSRTPLLLAAAMAFGHGATLAVIWPGATGRLAAAVLPMWLLGTLLFSGSLAARHLAGLSSAAAPAGGLLLMAAWILQAIAVVRR